VLRAELTRHGEHTHHIKAGHAWATAELSILRERFEAIEVLRERNRALERRAASADELGETVVRLEGKVEAGRTERVARCVSRFRISGVNLTGSIRARNAVLETPTTTPVSITQSLSAFTRNTRIFLKNMVQAALCCASARRCSLMLKLARRMPAQLPIPSSRPLALRKTARLGSSALLPLLSGRSDS